MPPHHHRIAPQLESHARRLRRDSTFPERLLWSRLRVLQNLKFRRQAAIDRFVADFYCPAAKLIIELDGASHDGRLSFDASRTARLESLGYEIVRYTNDQVLDDVDLVAEDIYRRAMEIFAHRNVAGGKSPQDLLSLEGEGRERVRRNPAEQAPRQGRRKRTKISGPETTQVASARGKETGNPPLAPP